MKYIFFALGVIIIGLGTWYIDRKQKREKHLFDESDHYH